MKLMERVILLTALQCLNHIAYAQEWHFEGKNVAKNKSALQYPDSSLGPASRAVDGNTNRNWYQNSCSHTKDKNNGQAYWKVLLDGYFIVKGVKLYNRNNFEARLKDFKVFGGQPETMLYDDGAAHQKLYMESVIPIKINSTTPFSEIKIFLPERSNHDYSILTLCEVEVFAVTNGCIGIKRDILRWHIREGTGHYNSTYGLISENSVLNFTCADPGYRLSNTVDITCLPNGNYSTSLPTCNEIVCPVPNTVDNGVYINSSYVEYKLNDIVTLQCRTGYKPIEPQVRKCLETSSWNDTDPTCTLITCPFPETFTNGTLVHMNGSVFKFGVLQSRKILNIVCNEGFITDKNTTRCTINGTWSIVPMCHRVKCESLMNPPDGNYTYNNEPIDDMKMFVYGTVARLICSSSVYKKGGENSTLSCSQGGIWIGNKTICGENIKSQEQEQSSSILPGVIGGSIAGVLFLTFAVIFAVYFLLYKRRRADSKHVAENDEFDNIAKNSSPDSCYENTTPIISNDETEETAKEKAVNDQYYNCNEIQRIPCSAIQLSDLPDIVFSMDTYKDKLTQQFKSLPYGLKQPCNSALEAKGKNRYRNLYAYDATRVVLDVWNKKTETDYINACFVHGYHRPKAYIASQGPTKDIISDFWRMIWQNKSDIIIMLTNLKEHGKMKSEKYWPDHDSMNYGMITVTMARSETFSNFVIRTFYLKKDDEERRTVTQCHFTSWPDKDVPLFCSSLIHFHHKVKDVFKPNEAPMVVHCSAGIGRTGTFIAIDYLYDQAKELGYIDVLGCVESLRQQRVNMVQTKNQYVFVHIALAEIFSLKTSCVPTATFEDHYKQMLNKKEEKEDRKIDFEFEMLEKLSISCEDEKTPEQKENASKVEDFMPSISQQGLYLFGEYIDAAFLPIYREDNALIITRSPSERTVEDFWKLIYHQKVHTVVMMEGTSELCDNKTYWPSTDKDIKMGEMTITSKTTYTMRGHTLVSLKAAKDNKESNVLLIQFGGWNANQCTPDNSESLLSALELVEENQRKAGISPVLVHCMDGVEKSGLFCVITSVLDRLKIEQDVAISQVIQEIRSRRPNVIPNVDQFQFCHDVVLSYLQRNETYANFNLRE